jgi:3-hydroxyisobutyrate dehydrogenase-like beta-hydroxyacid dehydrogenase
MVEVHSTICLLAFCVSCEHAAVTKCANDTFCLIVVAAIMNHRFDPHFPLQHQQKDLRLVLSMGDSVEQPLHLAAAANEVCIVVVLL